MTGIPFLPLSTDEKLIRQYANTLYFAKSSLSTYIEILKGIEKKIPLHIHFLENQYNLD